MNTASLSVTFQTDDGTGGSGANQVTVGLDADKNTEVYGVNKTGFSPGETAYLYVVPHARYRIQSSAGIAAILAENLPFPKTETVEFADSATAELDTMPMGGVSFTWLGRDGGIPLFTGRTVSLPRAVVGVMEVTYVTAGDRIRLDVTAGQMAGLDELPVVVVATNGDGDQGDTTVTYSVDGSGPAVPVPVDIAVQDFCTGDRVPGASVYLDGVYIGDADSEGIVYAGELIPGQTYALKIVATGYTDSDDDVLYNDGFTVPI